MREKPLDVRVSEAIGIRKKLDELGVGSSDDPGVARLRRVLADFVRGHGFAGNIPIRSIDRVAVVKLSLQEHVESVALLRAKPVVRA